MARRREVVMRAGDAVDRKFRILAVNPVNGKIYTEKNAVVFVAKDKALPAALRAYKAECERIGADANHVTSVGLLIERVVEFQDYMGGGRVPDTVGAEIPRCINGEGVE